MKPIHVGNRDYYGVRKLYTKTSKKICLTGKNVLGKLHEDWCKDDNEKMVMGWYWETLNGEVGKTFCP